MRQSFRAVKSRFGLHRGRGTSYAANMPSPKKSLSAAASRISAAGPDQDFLAGKLLIAMPNMSDPRFEKSVVLVCSHDRKHAMGVVVNKPLPNIEMSELLEQLSIDPREGVGGEPVYYGGPVQTDRGIVVHSPDYNSAGTMTICEDVGVTASRDILVDIAGRQSERSAPERFFLAIGHAGWGAGQLEREISQNAWAHCEFDEGLVFADKPDQVWRTALEKLGVNAAMFSAEWAAPRSGDAPLN